MVVLVIPADVASELRKQRWNDSCFAQTGDYAGISSQPRFVPAVVFARRVHF